MGHSSRTHKTTLCEKGKQIALAALEELAPQNSEMLLSAIQAERQKSAEDMDSSFLEAMVECYENCGHWSSRRQMLSIIADKVRFATVQRWLPDLSRYRYNIARHHRFLHGRGTEVPQQKQKRIKVSPDKLDHFLAFITSAHIIQDLPFGEKTLRLSSGSEIKKPNVIRTSIPEQIIKQYQGYCAETEFSSPFSHSSLSRILNVCAASTRKSLQRLDYFSAEGAKAFNELVEVADKLGDNYENGLSLSKEVIGKLKLAKRYFKEDYKVSWIFFVNIYPCLLIQYSTTSVYAESACIFQLSVVNLLIASIFYRFMYQRAEEYLTTADPMP